MVSTPTKEDLLDLLRELKVQNLDLLQDPEITAENLILALKRFRISAPDNFYAQVADRLGLAFMERETMLANLDMGCILPYAVGEEALIILLESHPTYIRVATANPLDTNIFEELKSVFSRDVEKVVVPLDALLTVTDTCYQSPHAYSALSELIDRQPEESAYHILVPWQKGAIILATLLVIGLTIISPYFWLFVFFTIINITYFVMNPVKFYISLQGLSGTKSLIYVSDDEVKAVTDDELPMYTVLVPLFHEQEMLPHILHNISKLDYPREKLDVKILMEEEDTETLGKARKLGLFGNIEEIISPMTEEEYRKFLSIFHPVVVPNAELKTKPRACNYGLKRSRGEFVVIYDAEDFPDHDQLKKVVLAFRKLGPEYACVQCLLNFYNPRKNILTRWFSIEYSYYYDYYIQGLDKINAPIPLGGTSNHFRMKTLRELGAWDPFNVTEDADLGMRIARKKYKTGVLNSHTYEEAVTKVPSWIKQRSRWVKGFVITWFVTMRHPIRVLQDIGLKNYIIFHTGFGGNFYLPLMNLFLWLVFIAGFIIPDFFSRWFDFWPFAAIAVFNLLVGNLFFLSMMLLATWKEKQKDLLLYSLFSPVYWILMSIGAWKGTLQLVFNPHKWEKTAHGVAVITDDLIQSHPDDFSRPVTWIEVKAPEVEHGSTKATVPQIAFSIGLTIVLVLLALVVFGVISYAPISDHVTINKIPGLSQAIAPYEDYIAGREVRLLNYEALPGPHQTAPPIITREPRVTETIKPLVVDSLPQDRSVRTIISDAEPGIAARYDPVVNIILITAENPIPIGDHYEILIQNQGAIPSTILMEQIPGSITIPGGSGPADILIFRVYQTGAKLPVLQTTI